jgi:M6 family metalloprotease-like protein
MYRRLYRTSLYATAAAILWLASAAIPVAAMPPHPDIQGRIHSGDVVMPMAKILAEGGGTDLDAPSVHRSGGFIGPFRARCVLVDFSDNVGVTPGIEFDTLVFADRNGTVRDYYDEVSYGTVDMITVNLPSSLGWKRAPQTYAYYVDNHYGLDSPYPHNCQKLCEDLVDLINPLVDFSNYDNDGDGLVDAFLITHAGPGAEFTGRTTDIWSHKWSIIPRNRDGVYISDYAIMPEYWSASGDMTIGVYCHELGHVLGLPDLYDTDGSSRGVGNWSIMATGSWNGGLGSSPAHPDAWCKARAGWLTPTVVATNQSGASIPAVETNATAFRLWTSGAVGNQYFLVENRQKSGYDAGLPSSGLLVWHVDDACSDNTHEWYPGHTGLGHYWVALEQADNLYQLEQNASGGDGSDPFPGTTVNRSFSPSSSPNSDSYAGTSTLVAVTNISNSGPVMTADFAVSLSAGFDDDEGGDEPLPDLWLGQNYPNPFNPVTTIAYTIARPGDVAITVYNIRGERVTCLVHEYLSSGTYTVSWNGRDGNGLAVASGVYFYELTTDEGSEVRKMLFLK